MWIDLTLVVSGLIWLWGVIAEVRKLRDQNRTQRQRYQHNEAAHQHQKQQFSTWRNTISQRLKHLGRPPKS